jgi:hypothetical protein
MRHLSPEETSVHTPTKTLSERSRSQDFSFLPAAHFAIAFAPLVLGSDLPLFVVPIRMEVLC